MPGVVEILTGADFIEAGLGDIPCVSIPGFVPREQWFPTPFPALASDRVTSVGDPIAFVVAESLEQALDAAELVDVEFDSLPVLSSIEAALDKDAIELWPDISDNIAFYKEFGDRERAERAIDGAEHVVELTVRNRRVYGAPLEPRAAVGTYDPASDRYSLITSTQNPHSIRRLLSEAIFKKPAHRFHVVAGDVGGGFGTKGRVYAEDILVLWASARVGRPVKWTANRSESFIGDFHGRDQMCVGRIGLNSDGRVAGLQAVTDHNVGGRLGPATGVSPFLCGRLMCGPYDIPAAHVTVRGVFSNTRTTTSYRGAGRPEATYFIEQILDKAADRCGLDPAEIRRRNLIQNDQMPYKTALLDTYDCGDVPALLEKAQSLADWDGFAERRATSEAKGKLRGRGLCTYVEVCAVGGERMEIRFDATGNPTIVAGTFSYGQGHETVFPSTGGCLVGHSRRGLRLYSR